MPKEVRYLLFSNEELYQALTADLRARAHPLPKGYLKHIHVGPADNPDIALTFINDKNIESTIRFADQDVLRALIVYCGYRRIPLSAKSIKKLEIKDGVVGLLCTLNFDTNKISATGGTVSYQDEQTDSLRNATKEAAARSAAARQAAPATKAS
jgi:hypothetical protein